MVDFFLDPMVDLNAINVVPNLYCILVSKGTQEFNWVILCFHSLLVQVVQHCLEWENFSTSHLLGSAVFS